jgi:hypothetical protein
MAKSDKIAISNTTQGMISLNCSFEGKDGRFTTIYHDIPPAREMVCAFIPREDWNRVKGTQVVKGLVDNGYLLPEKQKVTIDQETWKSSVPEPTGELAEHSLNTLAYEGKEATTVVGSRKARTKLNR